MDPLPLGSSHLSQVSGGFVQLKCIYISLFWQLLFPLIFTRSTIVESFLWKLFLPPPQKKKIVADLFLKTEYDMLEHANPGDYNANWFATFECSSCCQLLATIKCYCVPPLGAHCHLQRCYEWCQAHPLTPCLRAGTPLQGVLRSKSPPLPLLFLRSLLSRDALRASPFPVLLVTRLLLSSPGPGAGSAALQLSMCVFLRLFQLHTVPHVYQAVSHHRCSRVLLHLQHFESRAKAYHLGQFLLFSFLVLILQIINLNEGGSDFPLFAAPRPLLHSNRPADKHCT